MGFSLPSRGSGRDRLRSKSFFPLAFLGLIGSRRRFKLDRLPPPIFVSDEEPCIVCAQYISQSPTYTFTSFTRPFFQTVIENIIVTTDAFTDKAIFRYVSFRKRRPVKPSVRWSMLGEGTQPGPYQPNLHLSHILIKLNCFSLVALSSEIQNTYYILLIK